MTEKDSQDGFVEADVLEVALAKSTLTVLEQLAAQAEVDVPEMLRRSIGLMRALSGEIRNGKQVYVRDPGPDTFRKVMIPGLEELDERKLLGS